MFIFLINAPFADKPMAIALKTSDQRIIKPILYNGEPIEVETLQKYLRVGHGAFGHPTSDKFSTAEDIHAFLVSKSNDGWTFKEKGDTQVETYVPAPQGAMY